MERGLSMGTEDRALNIQNSKWRSRMLRPQEPELLLWHKDINEALESIAIYLTSLGPLKCICHCQVWQK